MYFHGYGRRIFLKNFSALSGGYYRTPADWTPVHDLEKNPPLKTFHKTDIIIKGKDD